MRNELEHSLRVSRWMNASRGQSASPLKFVESSRACGHDRLTPCVLLWTLSPLDDCSHVFSLRTEVQMPTGKLAKTRFQSDLLLCALQYTSASFSTSVSSYWLHAKVKKIIKVFIYQTSSGDIIVILPNWAVTGLLSCISRVHTYI